MCFGLIACSSQTEEISKIEEEIAENEGYQPLIKVAWEFVKKKGWDELAKGDWRNATVELTDTSTGHILDGKPHRDEVLMVTFTSKENLVIEIPQIFVDLQEKEVIGYVPSE
ncbi:hypothetical protein [Bacillus tianshenii]|uniref:hypothetical protein n=1 Tax=Sutcliffiella TaxID=2837511 RepID=UPI001CD77089|nr:hypothetical protein [Bacillus tianshenii]MCA1322152.1 hypothetical protein [Bacillus tianshenii]